MADIHILQILFRVLNFTKIKRQPVRSQNYLGCRLRPPKQKRGIAGELVAHQVHTRETNITKRLRDVACQLILREIKPNQIRTFIHAEERTRDFSGEPVPPEVDNRELAELAEGRRDGAREPAGHETELFELSEGGEIFRDGARERRLVDSEMLEVLKIFEFGREWAFEVGEVAEAEDLEADEVANGGGEGAVQGGFFMEGEEADTTAEVVALDAGPAAAVSVWGPGGEVGGGEGLLEGQESCFVLLVACRGDGGCEEDKGGENDNVGSHLVSNVCLFEHREM
ncbi:uncharacterized protein A4U43_C01F33160 [Asparagus officinalis]|uniref:Uncharacterized protein n=1 Tax=Asparagus officinalis TaxID=4686 RepID=A0A5P1FU27_ASPOF|nr:uncharacterized protein A4U43_C01F33160 [Asparagus officinalis]